MKKIKTSVSLLLALLMLITSIPFVVTAAEEPDVYISVTDGCVADSFKAENSARAYFSFFDRTVYDGCYGNQLSGLAKDFYDAIVKHYVSEKRIGEYSHSFGNAFTFKAEVSNGDIVINAELAQIFLNLDYIVQVAMDAFLYDHPEIFWLRSFQASYSYSVYGNTGKIDELTVFPVEIYSGASLKALEYEEAVDEAVSEIVITESRYETLKNVHDYICNKAYYNLVSESRVHSSEPFFIGDGGIVCEGYAKAFKVICDRLDIPCALVSGDAGGAHMWNYVQMDDNNWYLVDSTWDDQDSQIYYTYFIANASTVGFNDVIISEERTEHSDFSGSYYINFIYPELSTTEYNIHTHEWEDDFTVDVEPTCTEKGSKSIHCKYCEAKNFVATIDATHHADKTAHIQQEPTCTEVGYTEGVLCNDCGKWLEGHKEIPALSHDIGDWSENSKGKHIRHCKRENCDYTEGELCTYGEWIVTKAPTCRENGIESKFCSVCNHEITMSINALTHTPSDSVEENRIEPDCENDGSYYEVVYCSGCGIVLSKIKRTIPALTHKWDSGVINIASTCKTYGTKIYTCLNNSEHTKTEQITLDSNKHEGGTSIIGSSDATCFAEGYTGDTYCNGCGVLIRHGEIVPVREHILSDWSYDYSGCHKRVCMREDCYFSELLNCEYGDWVEVTAPTCSTTGELERTCKFCGSKDYTASSSTSHTPGTPIIENLVEATCTKDGSYNECINCVDCGTLVKYTRNIVIPAIGHDWDEGVIRKSTCNEVGYITYSCLNDESHTYVEYLSGFDYSNHVGLVYEVSLTPPTCTSVGYKGNKICSACEKVVEYGETVPVTAHKYETIVVKPATLTADGESVSKCSVCGDTKNSRKITKIGSFTLSTTDYVYDGKNKTPKVTVLDADGNKLVKNVDYKTSIASSRSNIGKYYVKVTFIGNYSGTKNVYFYIRPAAPKTLTATQSGSYIKLTWDKVNGAAGYVVYRYNTKTSAYEKLKATTATSYTDKELSAGTKYTYKVVPYGKSKLGNIYYSKSNVMIKTATKTKTPTVTVSSTVKTKATVKWNNVSGETGYQIWYSTSKNGTYKRFGNAKANATSMTVTGLTRNKTYYFKVRTYTKTDSGYVYGSWSTVKSVKVK